MSKKSPVVMIVDDDQDFIQALSESITRRGFEVLAAENGTEAFRLLQSRVREFGSSRVDAIVSDWVMEGGDGIALLARVRKSDVLRKLPFILASGQVSRDQLYSAIHQDADCVLLKPFGVDDLINKIREAGLLREAKQIRKEIDARQERWGF